MLERFYARASWPVWVILAVAIFASIGTLFDWSKSDWAAWVQAIGSIGAILATGWAVHRSHRLEAEVRQATAEHEYTQLLEYAYQLVGGMCNVLIKIRAFNDGGIAGIEDRRAMLAEVQPFSDALRNFDVARLREYSLVRAVLAGDALTRKLVANIERTFETSFSASLEPNYLRQVTDAMLENLRANADTLAAAIQQRGGSAQSDTLIP